MKLNVVVSSLILAGAMVCAMPASANILAQRNCSPGDVNFANPQTTTCTWKANDDNPMQITFHGAPNKVQANINCNFNPSGSNDKITQVIGHKAATITNLNISGNTITFTLGAPATGDNANVLFYVNSGLKHDYTPGDVLTCSTQALASSK